MKALILTRYARANNLTLADIPTPVAKASEILVKVHAVGLNPVDNMLSKGAFKPMIKLQLLRHHGQRSSGAPSFPSAVA